MFRARERKKGKEKVTNEEIVIDIVESEEKDPLLSRFFNVLNEGHINEPLVKFSLLFKEINHILNFFKALQSQEKAVFQRQRILSRNSKIKKAAKITGVSTGTIGVSLGCTVTGWTFFGIRDQQAIAGWNKIGDSFDNAMNAVEWAWFRDKIPGQKFTCDQKEPFINFCNWKDLEPFCQGLRDQFCTALNNYIEWHDSMPTFDGLQIFLVIFSVIATIALIGIIVAAACYRGYFLNLPTIPAPVSNNNILNQDVLAHKMNAAEREKTIVFLEKLENLSGIKMPDNFAELIQHLESLADKIRKNEQEAGFLFYLLENPRRNMTDMHRLYQVARNSEAPQLILNYLSDTAFERVEEGEKEQLEENEHDERRTVGSSF